MKKRQNNQTNEFEQSLRNNEGDANIAIAKASVVVAVFLLVLWICYMCGLFNVSHQTLVLINIFFPINIVIFISFLFYIKTKFVYDKRFKYFLIIQFVLGIALLNVVIPKHAVLGWGVCLALCAHYYSPRFTKVVFIVVLATSLVSLYGGMFIGEWDGNLFGAMGTVEIGGQTFDVNDLTPLQRVEFLNERVQAGDNRYLKVLYYYYLARAVALTILFIVVNRLSKRTLKLLKEESAHASQVEKFNNDVSLAAGIQLGVLPQDVLENENCIIASKIVPAKEVGGDFYDYFKIDNKHIALVVGDVSGKGIPASLYMMKTETLIKSLAISHKNKPALIMQRCNQALCEGNKLGLFVTCWLGILNTVTGELIYCNAGHNAPLISYGKEVIYTDRAKQIVLGAFMEASYKEESLLLGEGDKLILYTDGVTEAHNPDGVLYGENRLKEFVENHIQDSVDDMVNELYNDVVNFSNGAPQFDDITMLAFQYKKAEGDRVKKTYEASVEKLDDVLEFVRGFFEKYGFDKKTINSVGIAVEESFVNVCHYAYKGKGPIDITLIRDDKTDEIFIELRDMGLPFNPLLREDPNIDAPTEERDIGGLGIFMVKKIMDDVSYKFINNCNVLILGKKRNLPNK